MTATNWNQLIQDHEIAYLRGDLATSSPESYSIEEMRAISDGMEASTAEVEAAIRADFASLSPHVQMVMLDLLGVPGTIEREWWESLILRFEE